MAGPDSKRLYLAIIAQNLDNIKSERAYWNKNFVPITPSGAGTKYTTLQAAMLLKKMRVVKYLVGHSSIDISMKSTDGRTTLMIAAQSSMPVLVLQKVLEKYDLKTVNECDPLGKTALDFAEKGSEPYEFLESVGCQTKAARDACLQGFFGSAGKHAVHQRLKKKDGGEDVKSSSCPPAETSHRRSEEEDSPRGCKSEGSSGFTESRRENEREALTDEGVSDHDSAAHKEADFEMGEETPWQLFEHAEDLLRVLQNYLDTWGEDGEEGELCRGWIVYLKKKMKKNVASEAVAKWNKLVVSLYGEENASKYKEKKRSFGSESPRKGEQGRGDEAATGFEDLVFGAEETGVKKRSVSGEESTCDRQTQSDRSGRAEKVLHQRLSSNAGNSIREKSKEGTSETSPCSSRKNREKEIEIIGKSDNQDDEGGGVESDISTGGLVTIPDSLRGFFNPQPLTEDSADSTSRKQAADSVRRRTLGVWIDKAEAREKFAEVLPKTDGDSRRRQKKDSKSR